MESRHGLVIDTCVTQATGTAEREAALAMAEAIPGQQRVTLGADKNYDTHDFVRELRELRVTPHVAQHTAGRTSAIDARTTRHPGYAVSQRKRKRVERDLWLDENGWAAAQNPVSRRGAGGVDVHLCGRRVQPRAAAHAGSSGVSTWEGRKPGSPLHLAALVQPGDQSLVMFQRPSHRTSGIFACTDVELLAGVFQQPARKISPALAAANPGPTPNGLPNRFR